MKKLAKEFKEFALQGNLFDMAVGVLIGGVFKDLVASFTNNVIMPIIGIFTGSVDFTQWKIALPSLFGDKIDPETGEVVVNYLKFGDFISSIITFIILAIVIFIMIKGINSLRAKAKKKKEAEEEKEEEEEKETAEQILAEIRDLLKKDEEEKSEE